MLTKGFQSVASWLREVQGSAVILQTHFFPFHSLLPPAGEKKEQERNSKRSPFEASPGSDWEQILILHPRVPAKLLAQFDFVSPSQIYDFMHLQSSQSSENLQQNCPLLPCRMKKKRAKQKESSFPLISDLTPSGETSGLKSKFSLFTR